MLRLSRNLIAALCVIAPCAAAATTVSGTITTTTWTSAGSPYQVTGAITVPSGNTLTIEAGVDVVFDADVQFVVAGALRVHGTESDSVTFGNGTASQWGGIRISGGDSSSFEYTKVSDGYARGGTPNDHGGGVFVSGSTTKATLFHCVIDGNMCDDNGGGVASYDYAWLSLSHTRLTNNACKNTRWTGDGGGICVNGPTLLDHCLIANNTGEGRAGANGLGGGLLVSAGAGMVTTITNCTITDNAIVTGDRHGDGICIASPCVFQNTILYDNGTQEYYIEASGSLTATYSCVEGGYSGTGNITSDPLFSSDPDSAYHLTASSPCIDTGDPASDDDPDGTRADMGVFYHDQSNWTTGASMSSVRQAPAACAIGGLVYVVGGSTGPSTYLNSLEIYDPTTDSWSSGTSMPTARAFMAYAVANGKFCVIGGNGNPLYITAVEVYNPATDSWTTGTSTPTSRSDHAAAAIGDTVYVFGGYYVGSRLTTLEKYCVSANTWTAGPSMPYGRAYLAAAAVGGKLYVIGGDDGTSPTGTVQIYDRAANSWATGTNMPTARTNPALAVIGGKIHVVGGHVSAGSVATHEVYDPATDTWTTADSMPTARREVRGASVSGKMYVVGGHDDTNYLNTNEIYDAGPLNEVSGAITTTTWTSANSPYRVAGQCTVLTANTLTIESGVDVVFDEDVQFVVQGALRVHGTAGDSVRFIKGAAAEWGGIRISGGDSSSFEYCRISDGHADGTWPNSGGGGIYSSDSGTRLTMAHCVVSGNRAASHGGGIQTDNQSTMILTGCSILNNSALAGDGGGMRNAAQATVSLADCIISGNTATGASGGVANSYYVDATISGCTIVDNTATGAGGGAVTCLDNDDVTLSNCILWGNTPGQLYRNTGTLAASYCCIEGGIPSGVTDTGGNISASPAFVDSANGDYHLSSSSPCINTGDPSSDLDADGSYADMGAFLFDLTANPDILTGRQVTQTLPAGDYHVTNTVTVPSGDSLVIPAGTDVLFDNDVQFVVEGALRVHGTETDSVRFIKGDATEWGGIRISGGDSSSFEYARISHGHADGPTDVVMNPLNGGGGVYAVGSGTKLTMRHCTVSLNKAHAGGGIAVHTGAVARIVSCVIDSNSAETAHVGGIYFNEGGSGSVDSCRITRNAAGMDCGGFGANGYTQGCTMDVTNSLIAGNHASRDVSAVSVTAATVSLVNCTIADNTAASDYGIHVSDGPLTGSVTLTDAILWNNASTEIYIHSGGATASYSCIEGGVPAGVTDGGGNISLNPLFSSDPDSAYHLTASSPCIGAASDGGDMGAYSYGTLISGTIGTATWDSTGNPYRVIGPVTVAAGDTLTIEAGVDVLFDADVQFVVQGALRVHGTEADSVRFMVGDTTEWGGIRISGGDSSSFEYTRISDAVGDGDGGGIYVSAVVSMYHCVLDSNIAGSGGGFFVRWGTLRMWESTVSRNYSGSGGGGYVYQGASAELTRCTIVANSSSGAGGIEAFTDAGASSLRLSECLVASNWSTSAVFPGGVTGGESGLTVEITNCTIVDNSGTVRGGIWPRDNSSWTITNTVIWGNSPDEISTHDATPVVSYSCIQGGYTGTGNISEYPAFADTAGGDYSLLSTSPCINMGDPASSLDADGSYADMGAFPFDLIANPYVLTGRQVSRTPLAGDHHVPNTVIVPSGDSLVIPAGTDVLFDNDVQFIVEGALRVHGTEADSVRFIAGDSTEWRGIRISGGDSSSFEYARISDGAPAPSGGGIYATGSSTRISMANCVVSGNSTQSSGGAIFTEQYVTMRLTDCRISDNTAGWAGGIYNRDGSATTLTRCVIEGNSVQYHGGGMVNSGTGAVLTLDGCTIEGNSAAHSEGGGGLYSRAGATTTISNSIFWANTAPSAGKSQIGTEGGTITATYSCVQGGYTGTGNISASPAFVDSANGDYHLTSFSPCINTGDPASDLDTDGSYADMGAFPFDLTANPYVLTGRQVTQTLPAGDHHVTNTVIVPSGDSLVIPAGTDVLFDNDVQFIVEGALRVHGTETDSVRFIKGDTTEWGGIRISGGDSSSFEYARISDGDADAASHPDDCGGAIYVTTSGTRVSLDHSVMSGNLANVGACVFMGDPGTWLWMTDCVATGNAVPDVAGVDDSGGGVLAGAGTAYFERCELTGNSGGYGGAVAFENSEGGSGFHMTDCLVANNVAYNSNSSGGGLYLIYITATITNCTIADNSANQGGSAVFVGGTPGASNIGFTDCIIWDNVGPSLIWIYNSQTVTVDYSCVEGGYSGTGNISSDPLLSSDPDSAYHLTGASPCIGAASDGGDMGVFPYGTTISGPITTTTWTTAGNPYRVTAQCTVLTANTLTIDPGVRIEFWEDAQFVVLGALRVHGTESDSVWFVKGRAEEWGGIRIFGGDSTSFEYTRISGADADIETYPHNAGGGIYCHGPSTRLSLAHSVIEGNSARWGGGMHIDNYSAADISCCLIRDNAAEEYGGGMYTRYSDVSVTRCAFIGNDGAGGGGALVNHRYSVTTLDRCTFNGNSATAGGAIQSAGAATASLTNCILWGDGGGEISISTGSVTATYSCIEDGYSGTGNIDVDPSFVDAPAGDFHLAVGSPCIDAGDPSSFDPDGSYADMGAFAVYHATVASVQMGSDSTNTIAVTGTFSGGMSASLVFTISSTFIDSVTVVSHAFEGRAGAMSNIRMVGDTVRVGLMCNEQISLDGDTLANLHFHPSSVAAQDTTLAIAWVRGATHIDDWSTIHTDGELRLKLRYGDVTHDGNITATDAAWVLQSFTHVREGVNPYCADVSGNGDVSAYDAALVMCRVVDPGFVFPVEGGASLRQAQNVARRLRLAPSGDGWTLSVDVPAGVMSGGLVLAMPGDYPVDVTGGTLSSASRNGSMVRVGFVRDASDDPVLLCIQPRGANGQVPLPRIMSATLNEIPVLATAVPRELSLGANVPNPFNPTTTIRFDLPEAGQASLMIYNSLGQAVRTLAVGQHEAGAYSVVWDGFDDVGREAASGTYIYRLATDHGSLVRRMVLVR